MAILSPADEVFYGGQAGGGKTSLLLGYLAELSWFGIFFRREFTQLTGPNGAIEASRRIIGNAGNYNGGSHVWKLTNGRSFEFGAVDHESALTKYQGRAHDTKCFDEVSEYPEAFYLYLSGWARTTREGQRVRRLAAGNPPMTAEGQWVKRRWAAWLDPKYPHPAEPGELRWFIRRENEDIEVEPDYYESQTVGDRKFEVRPLSRTFIPATLQDNPYLRGTEYETTLLSLPDEIRRRLLGDFDIEQADDAWQVIPSSWVRAAMDRWHNYGQAPDMPLRALGVDVARGGTDSTAISAIRANYVQQHIFPGKQTPDGPSIASVVIPLWHNDATVGVDGTGVGSSAVDALRALGMPVLEIHGAASTEFVTKRGGLSFVNLRAAGYWLVREKLDPDRGENWAIPDDDRLFEELISARYSVTKSGILIEPKKNIIKRIGRSPDRADSLVYMALALRLRPGPLRMV